MGSGTGPEGYQLASLGDLMALIVEGWRITRLHYADRSSASGPPAAFFGLERGPDEWHGVFVPDDGRAFSHRSLVELFRESPEVWKYRTADEVALPGPEAADVPGPLAEVPEPFPDALALSADSLKGVVAVGQTQTVAGIDVTLVALERHDDAVRVTYMCRRHGAGVRGEMALADALAVDDAGRRYRVACLSRPPAANRLDGTIVIGPAVPAASRRITVTIGTVWEGGGVGPEQTPGPWVFPIALHPGRA